MIIRSCQRRPIVIFKDDILEYGWEIAILLGEIPQCVLGDGSPVPACDLHKYFPFFTKEKFEELLGSLISKGLATQEEE